ncbi:MAG: 2-oxoacid:acceptor oxidoreductase family protein [Thermodesulfobacteriota bacterium]
MYRIRMHGRGGHGIKTGSRILGSALFASGFEVQDATVYGAERRGAPISAYVRADRAPIHERGAITRPDLVVVGDDTLVAIPAAGVLAGVGAETVLLLRSNDPTERWRERLALAGPVVTLAPGADEDAGGLRPLVGLACAGAAARLVGVITRATLEHAVREELRAHDAAATEHALACVRDAFDAVAAHAGAVREGVAISAAGYEHPAWVVLPLDDVAVAAPDVHAQGTSALVGTGAWRTHRPVIEYERCNRCSWICSTLCPDGAIDVDPDRTPHVDYEHCKGCMICVAVCPRHAITPQPEHPTHAQCDGARGTA